MRSLTFDAITHRAGASLSRRGSLLALGGAGLTAGFGGPLFAGAKKAGKNKKKAFKKCKPQVAQCAAAIQVLCDENDTDPVVCAETIACCEFLGRCRADGFLSCTSAA